MSKEICHCDQRKLNKIFEQVQALSDVVEELKAELNELKTTFLSVHRENVLFQSANVNKIDYFRPNALREVRRHLTNTKESTCKEICKFTKNNQVV